MAHVSGMIQVLRTIFLAALSVLVPVSGVRAQEDMVAVSIVNGWQMADGSHVAALKFVLADGWKTYWRAPGEAGIPPQFDWRGSRNLARAEIEWPTPKQTMTNGMRTIGYEHVLVLPLRLTPADHVERRYGNRGMQRYLRAGVTDGDAAAGWRAAAA